MSEIVYHYTSEKAQSSILNHNELYFREITDFNKCNEDKELDISKYYNKVISLLKPNSNHELIKSLELCDIENTFKNDFLVNYTIDGLEMEFEDILYNMYQPHKSKVYIASFTFAKNSDEIYEKLSDNASTVLEIKIDDLIESINKYLANEIICALNRVDYTILNFLLEENINIRASFEGVIGKNLVYKSNIKYKEEDKINIIISDIDNKKNVLDKLFKKVDQNFKDRLLKLIYLDGHIFKEEKFSFEKEIRIIVFIPELVSEKLRVKNTEKDMIALKFDDGIIRKISFKDKLD